MTAPTKSTLSSGWTPEVRKKIALLQEGISSLAAYASQTGLDEATAKVLRQPYEELVEQLYTDEFTLATALDQSDIVIHVEGPAVQNREPRLGILTLFFDGVKSEVRSLATALLGLQRPGKLPKDLDMSLTALAPGSLYIGLSLARSENEKGLQLAEMDPYWEATKNAVKALGVVSRYLSGSETMAEVDKEIPNPRVKDIALSAFQRLSPQTKGGIESVEIGVKSDGARGAVKLTSKTRKELRKKLQDTVIASSEEMTLEGLIREVDLDLFRCEVRHIEALNFFEVRCRYKKEMEAQIREFLGKKVSISGPVQYDPSGKPSLMQIHTLTEVKSLSTL